MSIALNRQIPSIQYFSGILGQVTQKEEKIQAALVRIIEADKIKHILGDD